MVPRRTPGHLSWVKVMGTSSREDDDGHDGPELDARLSGRGSGIEMRCFKDL